MLENRHSGIGTMKIEGNDVIKISIHKKTESGITLVT